VVLAVVLVVDDDAAEWPVAVRHEQVGPHLIPVDAGVADEALLVAVAVDALERLQVRRWRRGEAQQLGERHTSQTSLRSSIASTP
jgi:hypothetical protein